MKDILVYKKVRCAVGLLCFHFEINREIVFVSTTKSKIHQGMNIINQFQFTISSSFKFNNIKKQSDDIQTNVTLYAKLAMLNRLRNSKKH